MGDRARPGAHTPDAAVRFRRGHRSLRSHRQTRWSTAARGQCGGGCQQDTLQRPGTVPPPGHRSACHHARGRRIYREHRAAQLRTVRHQHPAPGRTKYRPRVPGVDDAIGHPEHGQVLCSHVNGRGSEDATDPRPRGADPQGFRGARRERQGGHRAGDHGHPDRPAAVPAAEERGGPGLLHRAARRHLRIPQGRTDHLPELHPRGARHAGRLHGLRPQGQGLARLRQGHRLSRRQAGGARRGHPSLDVPRRHVQHRRLGSLADLVAQGCCGLALGRPRRTLHRYGHRLAHRPGRLGSSGQRGGDTHVLAGRHGQAIARDRPGPHLQRVPALRTAVPRSRSLSARRGQDPLYAHFTRHRLE